MTGVISYRTDLFEALKKLAKSKGVTISTLTSSIVENYLNYYQSTEERNFIAMPRDMLSLIYDSLKESQFDEIIQLTTEGAVRDIKLNFHVITHESIGKYIQAWFDHNGFSLKTLEVDNQIKYACRNDMGKNWNLITSKILVTIFDAFSFKGNVDDARNRFFSIKINERKSK